MASDRAVIRAVVEETSFGLYSKHDILKMSVKEIRSPVAFNELGNPLPDGLYDPALGPMEQSQSCITCGLGYRDCPGHLGHIKLSVFVYHPLLFAHLFKLLRAKCMYCHKFRAGPIRAQRLFVKLLLLDHGEVEKALALDDELAAKCTPGAFGDQTDGLDSEEAILARYKHKYSSYPGLHKLPTHVKQHREDVLYEFLRVSMGAAKCEACGAFSPSLRKDGHTKIFVRPLTKRARKAMVGMRMEMKSAYSSIHQGEDEDKSGDDSDVPMEMDSDDEGKHDSAPKENDKYMPPAEVRAQLQMLWNEHTDLLDYWWGKAATPTPGEPIWNIFFMEVVAVPPARFRPPTKVGEMVTENIQNIHLTSILNLNERLLQLMTNQAGGSLGEVEAKEESKSSSSNDTTRLVSAILDLQNAVNCLMDSSKDPSPLGQRNTPAGIRQILERKEGLFRMNMMGKRVNHACRSVISPDPYVGTNEIGIPLRFAMAFSFPEPVTPWNANELRKMVERGPTAYPGANWVEVDGRRTELSKLNEPRRKAIAARLQKPGTKVGRHLKNGDFLLVNRQPTLHKPGIMAHSARVLNNPKMQTLRMHYVNCNTYNADFDGDEMNCHFVQSEVARAEAREIAYTNHQYIGPTNGQPLRGLIQDHVGSAVKLTARDTFLNREQFQQIMYAALSGLPGAELVSYDQDIRMLPPAIRKPKELWTGKQVITCLLNHLTGDLPKLFLNSKTRTPPTAFGAAQGEHIVVLRHGELLQGVLDKAHVGSSNFGLVHAVYELYGADYAGRLLNALGRLFTAFLQFSGHSCGIEDLTLTKEADAIRAKLGRAALEVGKRAMVEFVKQDGQVHKLANKTYSEAPLSERERNTAINGTAQILAKDFAKMKATIDSFMQGVVNKSASEMLKACLPNGLEKSFPSNCFSLMVMTGAKGSGVNQSQVSCALGQQALEGQRVPLMPSGKSLPAFSPFDPNPRAHGFILDRFLTGVKPQEYFFHCMAGREGLIDTAVKTARSGYLQRCLVKHLEDLRVHYDYSVRNSEGGIVQFVYGDDGIDPLAARFLEGSTAQMNFLALNHQQLAYKYSIHEDFFSDGFNVKNALKMHKQMTKARKTLARVSAPAGKGQNAPSRALAKGDVVLARRLRSPNMEWARGNWAKTWCVATIQKVRTTSKGRFYDLKYSDGTVQEKVPRYLRIQSRGDTRPLGDMAAIILPGLPDPVMSRAQLNVDVGAVSERVQDALESFCESDFNKLFASVRESPLTPAAFQTLMWVKYMRSMVNPGEAVGSIAAQGVGEPSTQMTLNTFHLAGHGGANVTLGIPRLREILMTASRDLKTPAMTIPLTPSSTKADAERLARQLSRLSLAALLHHENGVIVRESLAKGISGMWERVYEITLQLQNLERIQEAFDVSYADVVASAQKSLAVRLAHVIQLELRRAGESTAGLGLHRGAAAAVAEERQSKSADLGGAEIFKSKAKPEGELSARRFGNNGDDDDGADDGGDEKTSRRKHNELDDSDDEDEEDKEEDQDDQGTLRFGTKKELANYEDADADDDNDEQGDESDGNDSDSGSNSGSDDEGGEDSNGEGQGSDEPTAKPKAGKAKAAAKKPKAPQSVGMSIKAQLAGTSLKEDSTNGTLSIELRFPASTRRLLMVRLVQQAAEKVMVRSCPGITNAFAIEAEVNGQTRPAVQTEGVNFEAIWVAGPEVFDVNEMTSNHIWKIHQSYGVEAARQNIVSEITAVFGVYGITVDPRHLSLIADSMTFQGGYRPMNRIGMQESSSPFLQMSFETTGTFLTKAAIDAEKDQMMSPSACVVMGMVPKLGTGAFDLMIPVSGGKH